MWEFARAGEREGHFKGYFSLEEEEVGVVCDLGKVFRDRKMLSYVKCVVFNKKWGA